MDVDKNDGGPGPAPSSTATEPSTSDPASEEKAATDDVDESDRVLRFGDLVRIVGK